MIDLKKCLGLGIAGNFASHLEQANEKDDFVNIQTTEKNAPKGIFPFFTPKQNGFLNTFPISSKIDLVENENIQVEPEIAILYEIIYNNDKSVNSIKALKFSVFNDATIRKSGVSKISMKKNWGENSKGLASKFIDIDKFESGGVMDSYSIVSYIKRNGILYEYGKKSKILGYSYFYTKLNNWIVQKLNTQEDIGPLEDMPMLLRENDYPKYALISIGATEYTEFGQAKFLKKDDEIFIMAYTNSEKLVQTKDNILLNQVVL